MVDFLVIGPINTMCYKNMHRLFIEDRVSVGYGVITYFYNSNKKVLSYWYSSFRTEKNPIEIRGCYDENIHKRYLNYDAIYIKKSEDIPDEYYGVMGVPFVFLEKVNRNQFDIIGMLSDNYGDNVYVFNGEERYIDEGHKHFTGPVIDGRALYKRLLIKKKIS